MVVQRLHGPFARMRDLPEWRLTAAPDTPRRRKPMLTAEQNELLTRIGPDTPAGNLMRRYWQPVAATSELEGRWTKRVRLLGENLVLFRDRQGRRGLINETCPHRGASLAYG